MKPRSSLLVVACCLLAGCPDRPISKIDPRQTGVITKLVPVTAELDILLVIDNSGSTSDKQQVFGDNFRNFIQALDAFPTGRPNVHIGVVSSSVDIGVNGFDAACRPAAGQNGLLQNAARVAGCVPPRERFLIDIEKPDGSREVNYEGSLEEALRCIALVGDRGCGFEAPLEAMKRALDGTHAQNQGFLRDGAYLAVIILTDEDDASVRDKAVFTLPSSQVGAGDFRVQPLHAYDCDTPISASGPGTYTNCRVRRDSFLEDPTRYFQFLSTVKDASQLVVALIGGDPTTTIRTGKIETPFIQELALLSSCSATINGRFTIGRPANRLADFLGNFGDHGLFRTVCQADYSQALTDIGELLFEVISPCLEGPLDTSDGDPDAPGLQLACAVSDLAGTDPDEQTEAVMPPCEMIDATTPAPGARQPCWWVAPDPTSCPRTPTQLELRIERSELPAPGTSVRVSCATAR